MADGKADRALYILRRASRAMPDDVSIALSRLQLACQTDLAQPADLQAVILAARRARVGSHLIYGTVSRLAQQLNRRPCPPFAEADLQAIPSAALRNPHVAANPVLHHDFLVLRGTLFLQEHRSKAAYRAFAGALRLDRRPDTALVAAAELYAADAPRLGLAILDEYERLRKSPQRGWTMVRLHRWWLEHIGWYRDSFKRVREALEQEASRHRAARAS